MQLKERKITPEQRQQELRAFVDRTQGWQGADIFALREDVSVRRFFRTARDGKTAILMDARPPLEDTRAYVLMQEKFDRLGLTVPEIYAADHDLGIILMEDFGDERFFELVTEGRGEVEDLYALATDALMHKFFADPAVALDQSVAYSDEYWLFRVEQFLIHYLPHVLKRQATAGEREDFIGLYRTAIGGAHKFDPVLLHGDYGAQNLYYLPQRPGIKAIGMIDFQDLTDARGNMKGSPAFDLVFFLQDVRVDLPAGLEDAMRDRFIAKTKIRDIDDFNMEYSVIGAAQATKCLGLFARLGHGDGRRQYLEFLPYCWRNLRKNLAHPSLKDIKQWFESAKIELG